MAQANIKKGFLFYFGLFVLLIATIFLICLVVMMFNPGKTILWMQYFTDNKNYIITQTSKGEPINWAEVNELSIVCSYADVTVDRNHNDDLKSDGVYVRNHAKGFSAGKNAKFNIDVSFTDDNKVQIIITEPSGFLYFSKDITVNLHAATQNSKLNFQNMSLKIETKDGDVDIGGTPAKAAENVRLKNLDVKTTSGYISISDKFETTSLTEGLSLKTEKGIINSSKKVNYNDKSGVSKESYGIITNVNTTLEVSGNGGIDLGVLSASGKVINLTCNSGYMKLPYVNAQTINVLSQSGNHNFGEVNGFLNYENSESQLRTPNITVDYLNGNFKLIATEDAKPIINIKEIKGELTVNLDRGDLTVEKANGKVDIDGDKISSKVTFAENHNSQINIKTESSSINLTFLGSVANNAKIESNTGNVNINITNKANFVAKLYKFDAAVMDNTVPVDSKKVSINIGDAFLEQHYDAESGTLTVGLNASNNVVIRTNQDINFKLVD